MTSKIAKFTTALVLAVSFAAAPEAQALSITPATMPQWTGNQTGMGGANGINSVIFPIMGAVTEYYKMDVGAAGDTGAMAAHYTTTFSNSASDPANALIDHVGTQSIVSNSTNPAWMLVKDGNNSPAWYLFNLTTLGWNGTEDLVLTGFWPGEGAISHVALYGSATGTTTTTSTPDGGTTVTLMGAALCGLAGVRRFLRRR